MDENNVILECDFEFKCPQQWENLGTTDDPEKRFCTSCDREVFFVTTRKEHELYTRLGRCVAANVHSHEFCKDVITAGFSYPRDVSTIHVFGDQQNADEVITALNRSQRKKKRLADKNNKEEGQA